MFTFFFSKIRFSHAFVAYVGVGSGVRAANSGSQTGKAATFDRAGGGGKKKLSGGGGDKKISAQKKGENATFFKELSLS